MTITYYQRNAQTFFDATVGVDMSSLYAPFLSQVVPGGRVLDAGCGSGRDTKAFNALGYQVEAFDASAEMVELAAAYTGLPVRQMTFNMLEAEERYDGIWCCASLLHLPQAELPEAMRRLARALKPGGVWYLSFKYGVGEREKEGRHFTDLNEAGLDALVAVLPQVSIIEQWTTQDKRPERDEVWLNALLRKHLSE
ncbi:class I SAM-dependent methyltransferase [Pseudescherichia vulneris]|uniref:class I SAM-dependent methyltransferase n=1 Tax=Pseudescherichia vulneris TaxID=566 RepID=UPI0012AC1EC8|nr:class I SAM-dependent methyltransferase [Pseudescherichia vulneris]MDU5453124.1 class I SAM-dependent methyltransferase [Pseudescherichia vulneris]